MRLKRYGIVLETLRSDHLEMVRLWRNQDHVRSNMQFTGLLSRTDQEQWFRQLDLNRNLYWIIVFNEYPIGLIHIKDINEEKTEGEAGIFIGEPSYLEMPQPMLAILFMMEMAFFVLQMKLLKAKIRVGNDHAIRFNEKLGYRLNDSTKADFQYYTVDKGAFEATTVKIRTSSMRLYGAETGISDLKMADGAQSAIASRLPQHSDYFKPYQL